MNSDIIYLVTLGIAGMLVLMVSVLLAVLYNHRRRSQHRRAMQELKEQQQNQLIEAAVRSEETERHRIAETLHDEVGAILSSAKLHLLGIKTPALDEKDKTLHEKGGSLLNSAIKKVRGISHNLHSNILQEFGLNEAIRHFLKEVAGGALLDVETNLDESYTTAKPDKDISLYRMVQELVNNIIKYAGAKNLSIDSLLESEVLTLTIFHDGNGIDQQQFEELTYRKEGLGLKNIKNRLILLKANILFEKKDAGSSITISMPVTPKLVQYEKDKTGDS
jgi:signal transduction histidine kinase